ncbi:peptidylprolyl isomerase [Theileria orientalis]|uniref:Peptidyl-prolyl cis-trans isomerase n=1 Tax=Theileria orientalis TaxID=68886 RepID=A0A976M9F8_THEOR|nr:peptidylprolyl isomerase [Theileria orientalis]
MDKVRCAHLLLKHRESRNPVNRNTGERVTRTKEEAVAELHTLLEMLRKSERPDHEFRRLATAKSECSSAKNGGDLGFFDRYTMQKPFTEASFKLRVNEISDLVETDSGFHLIYRIA